MTPRASNTGYTFNAYMDPKLCDKNITKASKTAYMQHKQFPSSDKLGNGQRRQIQIKAANAAISGM